MGSEMCIRDSYGANAFLGAINYVSATPTLEGTTGSVTSTFGSDERFDVSAELNTALIPDVLGLRIAGGYSEFDGDFTNNFPSDTSVSVALMAISVVMKKTVLN